MLSFVPSGVIYVFVNIVFFTGVIATILGFVVRFKALEQWRLIFQVVGVLALGAGLYFKGGYEVEQQWRARVAELEAKVAVAEAKSQQVNTVIKERVVTKIQKVKEVQIKNRDVIKQVEKIIDSNCTVPPEAIEILNAAARNEVVVLPLKEPSTK